MTRMTARDVGPALLELYDFYAHGRITRRAFLDRGGKYTAAVAALDMLKPDYALAQQVFFNDGPDIVAEYELCALDKAVASGPSFLLA